VFGSPEHLPYGECGEATARAIFSILERSVREELAEGQGENTCKKSEAVYRAFTLAGARGNPPLSSFLKMASFSLSNCS